jgi:hypothetical protein
VRDPNVEKQSVYRKFGELTLEAYEKPGNKSGKLITEASIEAQMEKLRVGQSTNQKHVEE